MILRLLEVAQKVKKFSTPELDALIQDMHETMEALNGAGLAAPQIGVGLQVMIFGVKRNPRYPDAEEVPYTVLVNPELVPSQKKSNRIGKVASVFPVSRDGARFTRLRYRGLDQYGRPIDRSVEGFHARVVQHECDHLQGILYPMRITNFRTFGFTDVLFPGQAPMDE